MPTPPTPTSTALLSVLERISDGVAIVAPGPWRVLFVNRSLADSMRKPEQALIGAGLDEVFGELWHAELKPRLEFALGQQSTDVEVPIEAPLSGEARRKVRLRILRLESDDAPLVALVFQPLRDGSEPLPSSGRRVDPLTGLPDRAHLLSRIGALLEGERTADRRFAVVFIDLDGFKAINDRHGHLVGDQVLREVSQRLRNCVREGDHVTRFGGDEFVILLERVSATTDTEPVLARIRAALAQPIELCGERFFLSLSIGVANSAPHHRSPEDVLAEADRKMYAEKRLALGEAAIPSPTGVADSR